MDIEKGQNLLELTIGLGLIAVVVAAVAISNLNGLKNSQFSQNQLQATKLAQEGIDIIRTIKERDYTVCNSGPVKKKWSDMWSTDCPTTSVCLKGLKLSSGTCSSTNDTSDPYWLNSSPVYDLITNNSLTFKREIKIENYGTLTQKQITVSVTWTDISGMHESKVSTILTQ